MSGGDLPRAVVALAAFAPLLAMIAYQLDEPIPEGFQTPRRLRLMFAGHKLAILGAEGLDYLGIYPCYKSVRWLFDVTVRTDVTDTYGVRIDNHTFDGVSVRVYRPPEADKPGGPLGPGVVFYHGGGLTAGSVATYHHLTLELARRSHAVVVSVDYRLVPEVTYPAPLDDCTAATKYFLSHAADFGVDSARVAIMGESAGGYLAAATALRLRDEDFRPMPRRQVLLYPTLQSVDFSLPSYQQHGFGPGLKLDSRAYFTSLHAVGSDYFRYHIAYNEHVSPAGKSRIYADHFRHEDVEMDYHYSPYRKPDLQHGNPSIWVQLKSVLLDPYFSPLLAGDFRDLPATCLVTVHRDMARDDGLLYGQKLTRAGVTVTHKHVTLAYHGSWAMAASLPEGQQLFTDIVNDLKTHL